MKRTHNTQNFSRSYYMNGSDYVIVGSTEESVVRIYSSRTGKLLRDVMFDGNQGFMNSSLTPSTFS
jgi:hypothetical protein